MLVFMGFSWITFSNHGRDSGEILGILKYKRYPKANHQTTIKPPEVAMAILKSSWHLLAAFFFACTPPETNMAPKNRYLEKEIPIGNHHLKVPC